MGETRVDLLHLLEDLRDAYPGALEETILTEIVANALDSGAARIDLAADAEAGTFTAMDNGTGMTRRELSRYHDLAATTKKRGRGIGFAGVGIKLALLACEEAVTETRRGTTHVATVWRLSSRHRAPWKWIAPPGLIGERGTAVRLRLSNPLSELLDPGFVESAVLRHFAPFFDPAFDALLAEVYPAGVSFTVNGARMVARSEGPRAERVPVAIRVGRKRKPAGAGWLDRSLSALPETERGIAISTLGKVIKRGWDWLGVTPAAPAHVAGLIEVPSLAESLTLNKADFIRTGPRGATYLAYRKAVQEAVTAQLAQWGDMRDPGAARRQKTRPMERDLEAVLIDLADEFPLLATLVERRRGGQKRLALGTPSPHPSPDWSPADALTASIDEGNAAQADAGVQDMAGPPDADAGGEAPSPPPGGDGVGPDAERAATGTGATDSPPGLPGERGPRRPARYGLQIRFADRPDDPQLGRLIESIVWVNEAHPAWRRAVRARAEGYHIALTVAMALAPLTVEPGGAHAFITTFLERWGREDRDRQRGGRRGRRSG